MTGQGNHRGIHFGILKSPLSFLHNYAESKAFPVRLDTLALILVEQLDMLDDSRRDRLQALQQARCGHLLIHHQGQVTGHRREAGHLPVGRGAGFQQGIEFDLEDHRRGAEFIALDPHRVQLADDADGTAIQQHTGRTAGVQGRVSGPLELRHTREQQGFEVGLDVVEVDVAVALPPLLGPRQATGQRGDAHGLVVTLHRPAGRVLGEAAADLEDADTVGLALAVGHQVGHQATDQGGAHHTHLAGDGVGQAHRVGVATEILLPGLFDKGEVDDLLVLAPRHQAAHEHGVALRFGARQHADGALGGTHRDVVIAVKTGDLLDEVFLDLQVEAVGRRGHDEVVPLADHLQVQAAEHAGHFIGAELDAQHPAHAGRTQADRLALGQLAGLHRIDDRTGLTAADVEDQAGGALDGLAGQGEVHTPLEAIGGVRRETVGTGTTGDGIGGKEGALEEQVGGVQGDAGILTPHDAGEGQGPGFVGDQQGVGCRGHGLAIEEQHLLTGLRESHVDLPAQLRLVEGVQRLAELEHHVVGHVHQRADGADAATRQALLHPLGRRRLGIHAADDPSGITRAGLGCVQHDGTAVADHRRHRLAGRQTQRLAGQGRHFPGDAAEAEAVGAVGRQLDREQGVVEGEVVPQVGTDRRILGQHQQTAAFIGDAQLLGRAQHAEGLDTAQLGRLDAETGQVGAHQRAGNPDAGGRIGRAADDLQQFALPRIHLADAQLVGVGMFFGLDDLRDHHLGEHGGHAVLLFHFQPRHGEQMPQRIRIEIRTDETAQPEF